jgi:hypothetical protein
MRYSNSAATNLRLCYNQVNLEHFQKYCSHPVWEEGGSGSFGFWLRFRSVTGRCGHAPSLSLAKTPKFLAAEWLQYFFKRSNA